MPTPRMKSLRSTARRSPSCGCRTTGGSRVFRQGPSANHLTIDAVDPGAGTQETKACLVNVVKADRHRTGYRARDGERHDVSTTAVPVKSTLIDITKCIGCHACQVACKHWNERDGEETQFDASAGLSKPRDVSAPRP